MYFPAAHVEGVVDPAPQYEPDGQSIGNVDPDGQYSPPRQARQSPLAVLLLNLL